MNCVLLRVGMGRKINAQIIDSIDATVRQMLVYFDFNRTNRYKLKAHLIVIRKRGVVIGAMKFHCSLLVLLISSETFDAPKLRFES